MSEPLASIPLTRIDGTSTTLGDFAGRVLLIVNVASKCGLTPQYEGLESLHERYANRGFAVLGFPANNFMGQEPGSNEEIEAFCTSVYGVRFPMFAKLSVAGDDQAPLYRALLEAAPARTRTPGLSERAVGALAHPAVRWNFEKFLIGRSGAVAGRFDPEVTPDNPQLVAAIEAELSKA
jgi:glutathione peroxidase